MSLPSSSSGAPQASAESSSGAPISRSAGEMPGEMSGETPDKWRDEEILTVCVVPQRGFMAVKQEFRKPRWVNWTRKDSHLVFTPDDRLQLTIEDSSPSTKTGVPTRDRLLILASHDVPVISFRLPAYFRTVTIMRLRAESDMEGSYAHQLLTVDGASTFNDLRLDLWQAESPHNVGKADSLGQPAASHHQQAHRRQPAIFLGEAVRIATDFISPSPFSPAMANDLTREQRDLIELAVAVMLETDIKSTTQWWPEWHDKIASILAAVPETFAYTEGLRGATMHGLLVDWPTERGGLLHQMARGKGAAMVAGGYSTLPETWMDIIPRGEEGPQLLTGGEAAPFLIPWQRVLSWFQGSFTFQWQYFALLWVRLRSRCPEALSLDLANLVQDEEDEEDNSGKYIDAPHPGWRRREELP